MPRPTSSTHLQSMSSFLVLVRLFVGCAAGDVGLLNDLLKDLEDPETLKEVEKLMNVRLTFAREYNSREIYVSTPHRHRLCA